MKYAGAATLPQTSEYNHDIGLPYWDEFEVVAIDSDRIRMELSFIEAAHMLLSDSFRYDVLQQVMGCQDVFEKLVSRLKDKKGAIYIEADIWSKRYRLTREGSNTQNKTVEAMPKRYSTPLRSTF